MIEYTIEPDKDGHLQVFLQETATDERWLVTSITNQTPDYKEKTALVVEILSNPIILQDLIALKRANYYKQAGDAYHFRSKYPLLRSLREQRECKARFRLIETIIDNACRRANIKDS